MASSPISTVTTSNSPPPSTRQTAKGKTMEAPSEPTETIRVAAAKIRKTTTATAKLFGVKINSTPAEVAIPFPPWNRSQQGKLCPKTAAKPAAICEISELASKQANIPLKASRIKTAKPAGLPKTRTALAAPMLPLPFWCKSTPFHRPSK